MTIPAKCVRCLLEATTEGVSVPYKGHPLCQKCRDVLDTDDALDREADERHDLAQVEGDPERYDEEDA